jgi:hypothetical protein
MSENGTVQKTNASNIGKANIGDHVAFSVSVPATFRGPARTDSVSGVLTAISVLARMGVIRATVDEVIYTLGSHIIVDVVRAPDATPMSLPVPLATPRRGSFRSVDRSRADVAKELFGVSSSCPADFLTPSHVGHEIAFRLGGKELTGVITSVARVLGGMNEVGVDGQKFVLPADKFVTVTRRRMSATA